MHWEVRDFFDIFFIFVTRFLSR